MALARLPQLRSSSLRLWHVSRRASISNQCSDQHPLTPQLPQNVEVRQGFNPCGSPLWRSVSTTASSCESSFASFASGSSSLGTSSLDGAACSNQLRRASAQQASTSTHSTDRRLSSDAAKGSRFPFQGKRKPPSARPHAGGPAPDVAAKQEWPEQVTRFGKVLGAYEVPRKQVFAVVELGPTQFKVSPGDVVVTEKIREVDVNDKVKLARVLMLGSRYETIIGRAIIPDASVTAVVEEQFQDAKVLIFKKRRRKNSRRLKGHRQNLTTLRIVDIHGIHEHPDNIISQDAENLKEAA